MLAAVFAFLSSLGWQEMFLLLVIGILLYGRNLPEAGRSLGRVAAQLRRGWQEFKDQMNRDADLTEMKKTLHDTAHEMRKVADVPRALRDPAGAVKQLAKDALISTPQEVAQEPAADAEHPSEAEHAAEAKRASEPKHPPEPKHTADAEHPSEAKHPSGAKHPSEASYTAEPPA